MCHTFTDLVTGLEVRRPARDPFAAHAELVGVCLAERALKRNGTETMEWRLPDGPRAMRSAQANMATMTCGSGLLTFDHIGPERASGSGRAAVLAARSAAAKAAEPSTVSQVTEPAVQTVFLTDLPQDCLLAFFLAIGSPLEPATAIGLARCACKGLRANVLLCRAAVTLRREHSSALALTKKAGLTLDRMAGARRLSWAAKSLTATDAQVLTSIFPHVPRLEELDLRSNALGDRGLLLLAAASARGHLPSLRTLSLSNNAITDEGLRAFAAAVRPTAPEAAPAFLGLGHLALEFNAIGGKGLASLAHALSEGAMPQLAALFLTGNPGDDQHVQRALSVPSPERAAATGPVAYLGGTFGTDFRLMGPDGCRAAKREHRGRSYF